MPEANRSDVKNIVIEFFSEECEVDADGITEETDIIEELDGDSLMFLELLEIFKQEYGLEIELKSVGKYVVKHPVNSIGDIIDMTMLILEHGNAVADLP